MQNARNSGALGKTITSRKGIRKALKAQNKIEAKLNKKGVSGAERQAMRESMMARATTSRTQRMFTKEEQ